MQQAPPADFNDGVARSGDVDWDGGWGRCRGSQRGGELCQAIAAAKALNRIGHGVAQD